MKEIYKEIEGYGGVYMVSNYGNVKSLKRKSEIILKPRKNTKGYLDVLLTKDGIEKQYRIHRLVADAFIANPNNKKQINHINGIKTDNNVLNLEWNTQSENMQHALKTGLKIQPYGDSHYNARLKETDVIDIRNSTLKQYELAKKYKMHKTTISKIKMNKIWTKLTI